MPSRAEQQPPSPPSIPGLAGPGANDEPSGAEQSQSSPRANQLPGQPYYEVATPYLMDLIVTA